MTTSPGAARAILPDELAARIRALGRSHGVHNIRVFGSFARGEATEASDLDLPVDYIPGQGGFAFVEFWMIRDKVLQAGRATLMPQRDERLHLTEILWAIDRILGYTEEGKESFLGDTKTQDAVVRTIEIIGEAAGPS